MYRSLPNFLTISRILLIPVIIIMMHYHNQKFFKEIAGALFAIAGITDFFDGYLARKLKAMSNFGKLLDPVADKLLVSCVLVVLVSQGRVDLAPTLIIITREFMVSGLRQFLIQSNEYLPVSTLSKVKTGVQMTAITILIIAPLSQPDHWMSILGSGLIWIASILAIITGITYFSLPGSRRNS